MNVRNILHVTKLNFILSLVCLTAFVELFQQIVNYPYYSLFNIFLGRKSIPNELSSAFLGLADTSGAPLFAANELSDSFYLD